MLAPAVTFDTLRQPASADARPGDGLARRAARGEVGAFEQLYRAHVGRVFALVRRLCGGHEARAQDLTQEVFVRAWQALPSFRFESAFATWLHRLAVNTALMELRARRSGRDDECDDDALDTLATPDTAGVRTLLATDLERAIASLPPRARAVLVLFDVEGLSHEEIAAQLDMAVGSSKAQLHRARGLLRARLGELQ
jgi:RNA polymerase sigma-70 factor (ECF subfamily)